MMYQFTRMWQHARKLPVLAAVLTLIGTAVAYGQSAPPTLPDHTVWGRLGTGTGSGPAQAIPFTTLFAQGGVPSGGPTGVTIGTAVGAFPGPGDPSVGIGINTGNVLCVANLNCSFSGNGVYPFQVAASNPYVIGAKANTINNAINGDTYCAKFTSTHLAGSPVTQCYTAIGGDTTSTVATALCAAINANPALNTNGLPLFCQAISSGTFNIQWQSSYSDMAVASTGSTGSITYQMSVETLDAAVVIFGRKIPGYIGQNGDSETYLLFYGQSSDGTMDAIVGSIDPILSTATTGAYTGTLAFSNYISAVSTAEFALSPNGGLSIFKSDGTLPAGGGVGFVTWPSNGGALYGTAQLFNSSGIYPPSSTMYGGTAVASNLNLISTSSGSSTTDYIALFSNLTERARLLHDGCFDVGLTSDCGGPGIVNVLTGFRVNNAATSANVLRGNGTNFIPAQLAAADLSNGVSGSGAVVLATQPTMTTPQLAGVTFAGLPGSPVAGQVAYVTDGKASNCADSSCTTWGTNVTAGTGALQLMVWYNGSHWTLTGK